VTEAAALSSSLHMGRGDEKAADQAAVNAMRDFLNNLVIDGTVAIGEGERDKAPMLYIGEKVGKGGPKVDIALDPLEGTTITAKGGENALSVLAMAEEGGFLHAPDIYMHKIAYGKKYQDLEIDPESPANEIVQKFSDFADMNIKNIVVCILDRPRHQELINKVRQTGARIKLISDGDVSAVIATSFEDSGVDMYMGIGGSPEGVLAAAALRCIGGRIYSKLVFSDESEKKRAADMGIKDANKIYTTNDLASGDVMFSATGVTNGTLLQGVLIKNNIATTQSVVMRSKTKTLRYVNASHNLTIKDIIT
jgi:fructose-1,6-bisphosphatase II / sedoheptulose-1,7-bisphosphatase